MTREIPTSAAPPNPNSKQHPKKQSDNPLRGLFGAKTKLKTTITATNRNPVVPHTASPRPSKGVRAPAAASSHPYVAVTLPPQLNIKPAAYQPLKLDGARVSKTLTAASTNIEEKYGSVEEARDAKKSGVDHVFDALGHTFYVLGDVIAAPFDLARRGFETMEPGVFRSLMSGLFRTLGRLARLPVDALSVVHVLLHNLFSLRFAESGQKAMSMFLQPFIGAVLLSTFWAVDFLRGWGEGRSPIRKLTEREREALGNSYRDSVLDRIEVVEGETLFTELFLPQGSMGLTMEDRVYWIRDQLDEEGRAKKRPSLVVPSANEKKTYRAMPLEEEAYTYDFSQEHLKELDVDSRHEIVHSLQYREHGGAVGMLSRYFADFLGGSLFPAQPEETEER